MDNVKVSIYVMLDRMTEEQIRAAYLFLMHMES